MITQQEADEWAAAAVRLCAHPSAASPELSESRSKRHAIKVDAGAPRHVPAGSCVWCGTTAQTILEEQPEVDSPARTVPRW